MMVYASELLPEPLGPRQACTVPDAMVSERSVKSGLSESETERLEMVSIDGTALKRGTGFQYNDH